MFTHRPGAGHFCSKNVKLSEAPWGTQERTAALPSIAPAEPVRKRKPKPVTVTFEGELAEAIRARAKQFRQTPQFIAAQFCENGCDHPPGGRGRMFIEVPECLRGSLERLAKAGDYEDGANDLALETWIDHTAIIDAAAVSLIRYSGLSRKQIAKVAHVAMEERLCHSTNQSDRWTAELTLGMEVPKQ